MIIVTTAMVTTGINCSESGDILLPDPERTGGMPLMEALDRRASQRQFSDRELTPQQLSNLLWAAWGYNREEEEKRTAPSSRNSQEIDIYVSLKKGTYIYDAKENRLIQVNERDIRALTGTQDFPAQAPVNLIFVADMERRGYGPDQEPGDSDILSAWANSGFISQNIYLYCASEGLASVVRAMVDRNLLSEELQLRSNQLVIMAHSVGFPQQ